MTTALKPKPATTTLHDKFAALRDAASKTFAERDEVVHLLVTALLSKQNLSMLGVPGVAKSAIVRYLKDAITGISGFEILMSRFTTPEQVFGPLDLKTLKEQGRQHTITAGMLPESQIAFLDEIWKSSNAILNSLLTAINERLFFDGAQIKKIPLVSVFAASNELPQSAELGALYDRFLLKAVVRPVSNAGTLSGLLSGGNFVAPPQITLAELEAAHGEIETIGVPADVIESAAELVFKLRKEGIEISDRAVIQACSDRNPLTGKPVLSLIKTQAWLEGRTVCEISDLAILKYVFWKDPKDQRTVSKLVNQIANPFDQKAFELDETVSKIVNDYEAAKAANAGDVKSASEAVQKLKKTGLEVVNVIGTSKDDPKFAKLVAVHDRIVAQVKAIVSESMSVPSPKNFQRNVPVAPPSR